MEIKEADQVVAQLYLNNESVKRGRFGYAWKRFFEKNYRPVLEALSDQLENNKIEHALTDEKTKEILYDEKGSYKYNKEGLMAVLASNRKLVKEYDEKEVEILPFILKEEDLPELTEEEKEVLTGLVV